MFQIVYAFSNQPINVFLSELYIINDLKNMFKKQNKKQNKRHESQIGFLNVRKAFCV